MTKLLVFNIHGIGQQPPTFSDGFFAQITNKLKDHEVKCIPIPWQSTIEPEQYHLWNGMVSNFHPKWLYWRDLRKFALFYASEVLAYQEAADAHGLYHNLHQCIDDRLSSAADWVDRDTKVIIFSHSLGTVAISNYLWDLQNASSEGNHFFKASEKARSVIENLNILFTVGSPIALFSLRQTDGGKPIIVKKWYNIYAPPDVVGYPLSEINEEYANAGIVDLPFSYGGLLERFTLMAHTGYFDNQKFVKMVAGYINASL